MSSEGSIWRASARVQRWQRALVEWVGTEPSQAAHRVQALLGFCASRRLSPDEIFERAARSDAECATLVAEANFAGVGLIVQSFLIHNGVNVYGRLVCMPRTAAQLAQQGARWTARR